MTASNRTDRPELYDTCTCGSTGEIHAHRCARHDAESIRGLHLPRPAASRRDFLVKMLAGGLTVAAVPLLAGNAQADLFKFMPTVADQKRLGEQAAQDVLKKYEVVTDSRAKSFDTIGAKLMAALPAKDRNTWDYKFHVISSKEVNAFAVPGGNMFMFTGLMDRVKSDSELAAVTGHEMTHVRKQHWAHAAASQKKREIELGVILGLTHASSGWQEIAGLGNSLYTLRYSRRDEDEADAGGLQNMVDAGYDPQGMLDLFRTLQNVSGGKSEGPDFLRDHPLTADRIRKTQQRIDKLRGSRNTDGSQPR